MKTHPTYEILEEIHRGAYSRIFRAFDRQLQRYVAIKMLPAEMEDDVESRSRMAKQAKYLSGLVHPNIVGVHSFEAEYCWIVMEYMPSSLREQLQENSISNQLLRGTLAQTLLALEFVHSNQRIHGTLHPGLMLIDDKGNLKIGGFSWLSINEELPIPSGENSRYIAPEIWKTMEFGEIGTQIDLYALGMILLECLSQKPLESILPSFSKMGEGGLNWPRWHTTALEFPMVRKILPNADGELANIVDRLLCRQSADRPKSAGELLKSLDQGKFKPVPFALEEVVVAPVSRQEIPQPVIAPKKESLVWLPKSYSLNDKVFFRWLSAGVLSFATVIGISISKLLDPGLTTFKIQVDPENAEVIEMVEGQRREVIWDDPDNKTIKLSSGSHILSFSAANFKSRTVSVEVPGKESKIEVNLEPLFIQIDVEASPADIQLIVDEKNVEYGNSKLKLSPGKHFFEARKVGYLSEAFEKEISENNRILNITLKPKDNELPVEPPISPPAIPKLEVPTEPFVRNGKVIESQSIGMEMNYIPAGTFTMGSRESELGRSEDEVPHRVVISKPFYIGAFEVTQGQFQRVMEYNNSGFRNGDTDDLPVENVSWFDSVDFCNRLSEMDGLSPCYLLEKVKREKGSIVDAEVTRLRGDGYRLPTEAEWEYACRSGSPSAMSFGNTISERQGNFDYSRQYNSGDVGIPLKKTVAGKSLEANSWGLKSMHGNVWEWCWDYYSKYSPESVDDPQGKASGEDRVLRGGSWMDSAENCRSANRYQLSPTLRLNYVGFRVARDVD